jgi:hypothetical protein
LSQQCANREREVFCCRVEEEVESFVVWRSSWGVLVY